jgi:hypothetical protein
MVHLVQTYYKSTNFCVITPYDAQRAAIETGLKNAGLPWDSVYNLDSFQGSSVVSTSMRNKLAYAQLTVDLGNEADYVLVSVVRSSEPGFLVSLQRMNVLLTRCRKGLVIVTSRSFIASGGRETLLGLLVRYWQSVHNVVDWIDWRDIASGTANLPGAPSRPRPAAHRMVPFSVPGSAYTVSHGTDHVLRSNSAVSPLSINVAPSQYPDFDDRYHFPTLNERKWPILPGSWTARKMPAFSVPNVAHYRPRATHNSASYVQMAAGDQATRRTPSSSSGNSPMPKNVGGTSTSKEQGRFVQGIPRDGKMSTHSYHRHSLLNNKSTIVKEAERKTKAKPTPNPVVMRQPRTLHKKYPATTTARPSQPTLHRNPPTTTSQTFNRPLANFIRSVVVYS